MRKPELCLCENIAADQLCGKCETDRRLSFHYSDRTVPLLVKFEISRFYPSSEAAQAGLCQTWKDTLKTGFLASRLI